MKLNVISKYKKTGCHLHRAINLNKWCFIKNNFFEEPIVLAPNYPKREQPELVYKIEKHKSLKYTDTLTLHCKLLHKECIGIVVELSLFTLDNKRIRSSLFEIKYNDGHFLALTIEYCKGEIVDTVQISISPIQKAVNNHYCNIVLTNPTFYESNSLTKIANIHKTDKGGEVFWGKGPHLYTLFYEKLFLELKDKNISLLEIGLDTKTQHLGVPDISPSISMWREFLPKASIFGFDINDFDFIENFDNNTFFIRGNQGSPKDLSKIINKIDNRKFDIILDDGSHSTYHQQISLSFLFPYLKSGGVYIIEDLHWQPRNEGVTTLEILTEDNENYLLFQYLNKEENNYIKSNIESIIISKPNYGIVGLLKKK